VNKPPGHVDRVGRWDRASGQGAVVTHPLFDPDQFVEAAADAIIAADADGSIVFWNSAAERIFGYSRDEALAKTLDIIIPERLRQRHAEGYVRVMRTGVTKYGADVLRVPAVHKDGHALSIAFTVTLMSAAGQRRLIVATVRDETQRWQEERSLRQRLAALEAANR